MKKLLPSHLFILNLFFLFILVSPTIIYGQAGKGYKVWVKTSPCSGRFDWISVAKENPTGASFYYLANQIFPGTACTTDDCSFKDAMAVAATLRTSPEFSKYCCRDYSVWKNSQTGKMSVVVGKFGTAGYGWELVKGDLCCEEAETLAGIPGACSGSTHTNNQNTVKNTKCWPGSTAKWNKKLKRVECYCNPGLVWNSTQTACIDPQELVKTTDCSGYPGSYAAWNAQAQRVECFCPQGKTWNAAKTACVDNVAQVTCYPGSYAAWNAQTQRTECFCNQGLVWNSTKTACVEPVSTTTSGTTTTGTTTTGTTTTGTTTTGTTTTATTNYTWTLVSTTANPPDPNTVWKNKEWTYSGTSPSAQYSIYNGAYQASFSWTPPPQQFNKSGFTVTLNAQGQVTQGQPISISIGASGSGITTDNPSDDKSWGIIATGTGSVSGQKSVILRPSGDPTEIEVKIGMMWGAVYYSYKYKRTP